MQFGEKIRRKLVVRFFADDFPEQFQADCFGQGGSTGVPLLQEGGDRLPAGIVGKELLRCGQDPSFRQVDLATVLAEELDFLVGNAGDKAAEKSAAVYKFYKAAGGNHQFNTLRSSEVMVSYSG